MTAPFPQSVESALVRCIVKKIHLQLIGIAWCRLEKGCDTGVKGKQSGETQTRAKVTFAWLRL